MNHSYLRNETSTTNDPLQRKTLKANIADINLGNNALPRKQMKNSKINASQKTKDGGISPPRLTKRAISNSLSPQKALKVHS